LVSEEKLVHCRTLRLDWGERRSLALLITGINGTNRPSARCDEKNLGQSSDSSE
jgi:hypothetical protein